MGTTFHPQTDGQSKPTIQTLEEMLHAYIIDFRGSSEDHLALIEFGYNNSYQASMAPFKPYIVDLTIHRYDERKLGEHPF